jgi:uncharacterized OB-fold protein
MVKRGNAATGKVVESAEAKESTICTKCGLILSPNQKSCPKCSAEEKSES